MTCFIDKPKPGILLAVCGLSGSGKSTLVRHALQMFPQELQYMNTLTTRLRRKNEDNIENIPLSTQTHTTD